jgi:hypothetical protein
VKDDARQLQMKVRTPAKLIGAPQPIIALSVVRTVLDCFFKTNA